ncbi:RHS repeat-associated core domain-containing protein, partial [Herbivorax sp. ANBcel31]|uniref:RHS repeat-associated core domain-containing protein n=1 Tax=Herbivorax sp. ANBcel31 TaxID=3069754 RepID=UPI0027B7A3D9
LEVNGAGQQTGRNVYGTNLLMRQADGLNLYYMYNGHADVTALLDQNGVVRATYYYDAFGNIMDEQYFTASGSTTSTPINNSIMYAGYQYDKETELYYLNARMYDPAIARFLQEDTYRGDPNDPLSLNLYAYTANNPITYYDPTEHSPVYSSYTPRVRYPLTNEYYTAEELSRYLNWKNSPLTLEDKLDKISEEVDDLISEYNQTAEELYNLESRYNRIEENLGDIRNTLEVIEDGLLEIHEDVNKIIPVNYFTTVNYNIIVDDFQYYTSDTNLMQSNIQFNPDAFSQPGSIMSINSGLIQIGADTGRIYIPRAIESTVKPNNIGKGTWNRYVSLESKTAVSKFTKVSRVARYAGWVSVGVDAGFGVYENIQEGAPTKRIVSDAAVDVGYGAGGLLTSIGTGALLGTFGVPVIGTVIGGAAAGIVYVVGTEVLEPGGKSIKNRTKDELYDRIK